MLNQPEIEDIRESTSSSSSDNDEIAITMEEEQTSNKTESKRLSMQASLGAHFEDPISLEIMKNAVSTHCGHSFSEDTLLRWMETNSNCPVCKQTISHQTIQPNYTLRAAITHYKALKNIQQDQDSDEIDPKYTLAYHQQNPSVETAPLIHTEYTPQQVLSTDGNFYCCCAQPCCCCHLARNYPECCLDFSLSAWFCDKSCGARSSYCSRTTW
eukprot:CAMPEP_0201549110 /NCGR_PEP_ID=MMETSP0173_2-20130828/5603_1 /ASSEMBLY_ACC=CAM_ASM_000268 /TAXON_ID=218659 /ORGANISM="Vexillifera sp., Strain DIVA3 564/2" /LENGTH=212 /DNA_ID=CAMNT_0047958675 /DNA_START=17 /DNA_END=652 /DNA_ORIENTATION=+